MAYRALPCAIVAMLGLGAVAACSGAGAPRSEADRTCSGAQALVASPYVGTSLGAKQIALTFDDGPASRTEELSAYLASQGIQAGFFVNGKNVAGYPNALAKLVADGHVVGNHTHDHFDMTDTNAFPMNASGNAKLVSQLAATDALIAPFVPSGRFMFRAPYGAFDARDYNVLSTSAMNKYVGHIGWDVGAARTATTAADWACWQYNPQLTTKACGDLYRKEIQHVERGIVLMHDADYGNPQNHSTTSGLGNTVDMVKYLVPLLKAQGYTFVRVDAVPAVASALPPLGVADAGADSAADAAAPAPVPDGGTSGGGGSHHGTADAGPTTPTSIPPATESTPQPATAATAPADPCAHASSETAPSAASQDAH
jgi:peptidoglycan/xylan/chitin deacetylase (PgdA/CDA1 family)